MKKRFYANGGNAAPSLHLREQHKTIRHRLEKGGLLAKGKINRNRASCCGGALCGGIGGARQNQDLNKGRAIARLRKRASDPCRLTVGAHFRSWKLLD